jgi:hypothetical protein
MHTDASLSRLERRLSEAFDSLWDSMVDPRDAWCGDDGVPWLAVGGAYGVGNACRPAFMTEQEHREIRAQCRALALTNEFAINGHENRVNYIVGSGHTYRATVKKHAAAPADLAADVQAVLDDFLKRNNWQRRQQEIVLRGDRDGEVFLRFFPDVDGTLRVRFVEPGQVSTPPELAGDPSSSFGIQTDPLDVETVVAYYIDGAQVDADLVQHRKQNVDVNVKRGLPLFYPVRKNLRRAEKLLRNMSVVAEIQSAIALIRRHRGGTRTAVQQFISQQTDATIANPATGKTTAYKRYGPGTILDANADVEYDFPAAALDAGSYVTVLQAELRAIAARMVMPEFMLTSDASNANYASTMVAEGPSVRMFERLQAQQVEDDLAVLWRAVAHAADRGRLPAEALTQIEIQAAPPSLSVRDRLEEANALRIQYESRILSRQTWSQLCGLDYDQEQANIAADEKR